MVNLRSPWKYSGIRRNVCLSNSRIEPNGRLVRRGCYAPRKLARFSSIMFLPVRWTLCFLPGPRAQLSSILRHDASGRIFDFPILCSPIRRTWLNKMSARDLRSESKLQPDRNFSYPFSEPRNSTILDPRAWVWLQHDYLRRLENLETRFGFSTVRWSCTMNSFSQWPLLAPRTRLSDDFQKRELDLWKSKIYLLFPCKCPLISRSVTDP